MYFIFVVASICAFASFFVFKWEGEEERAFNRIERDWITEFNVSFNEYYGSAARTQRIIYPILFALIAASTFFPHKYVRAVAVALFFAAFVIPRIIDEGVEDLSNTTARNVNRIFYKALADSKAGELTIKYEFMYNAARSYEKACRRFNTMKLIAMLCAFLLAIEGS